MAKAKEYGASSGVPRSTVDGKTSSSSAIGAMVASMRAPLDDDAVVPLLDDARRELAAELLAAGDRAVHLRRDQGVRGEQVVLAGALVVVADALANVGSAWENHFSAAASAVSEEFM